MSVRKTKSKQALCISPPIIIGVALIDAHNSIKITLWKSSNATPATAPRTREAMALQASPTKSGTENILEASFSSLLSFTSKCLQREGEREREGEWEREGEREREPKEGEGRRVGEGARRGRVKLEGRIYYSVRQARLHSSLKCLTSCTRAVAAVLHGLRSQW